MKSISKQIVISKAVDYSFNASDHKSGNFVVLF